MNADVESITRATEAWAEAFRAGDVSRTMSFVAPNAVLVPPNEPAVVGSDAIRAWTQGMIDTAEIHEAETSVDEVRVADGWAVSRGTWRMKLSSGDTTMEDTARYVVVWERRKDGSWKVLHDIWNSGRPTGT
jgi:ketosteroid isomerase-like protein